MDEKVFLCATKGSASGKRFFLLKTKLVQASKLRLRARPTPPPPRGYDREQMGLFDVGNDQKVCLTIASYFQDGEYTHLQSKADQRPSSEVSEYT